jgi:hypothetical protein
MVPVRKFSTTTSALRTEPLDDVDTLRALQVHGDVALVAVDGEEGGGLTVLVRGPGARLVTRRGVLHLHHVGPEIAQEHAAERPSEHAREVDHPHGRSEEDRERSCALR